MGDWLITFDREATARAHAAMQHGGADDCGCNSCRNFSLQKPVTYPAEFLDVLDRLGVDPTREIEVVCYDNENESGQEYHGWFYFVGHAKCDTVAVREGAFTYYFMEGPAYAVPEFEGLPVSRVEFAYLHLPWANGITASTPPVESS
jgi:hypothetical protein